VITSLKVGARIYAVTPTPAIVLADDGHEADVCHRTSVIRIPADAEPRALATLLLHETLHVLLDDAGVALPRKDEERIVTALAPRLAAFLADNPDAVRELLAMLAT